MDRRQRGSVLLPLIAGVLLMMYAGSALTELFSAQRMRAVHTVQSAQAYWSAEAGAWHAAQIGESIETPFDFAGTTYQVTRAGDSYSALAERDGVRRLVTVELERVEEVLLVDGDDDDGVDDSGDDLIDDDAVAASATRTDDDAFRIDLVSLSEDDLEIEAFELSADAETPQLKELHLDGKKIHNNARIDLPTGLTALNHGSSADRTIAALDDPPLTVTFLDELDAGTYEFTVVLHFVGDTAATVVVSVDFD